MDEQSSEHGFWLYLAIRDFAFVMCYFLDDEDIFPKFYEYKMLFLEQGLEKLLKGTLSYYEPSYNIKKLKDEGHDLHQLITKIVDIINDEQKDYLLKQFSEIGEYYFNSYGYCKYKLNLGDVKPLTLSCDVARYGNGLLYFSLLLKVLSYGFFEIRYPHEKLLEDNALKNLNQNSMLPLIYMSKDLIQAVFKVARSIMGLLGHLPKNIINQEYNWEHIGQLYDEPSDKIISMHKKLYRLLNQYFID